MVFPDPKELAVLTIGSQNFQEWETVSVTHALKEWPFYTFRFTCSEGFPLVTNLRNLQIIPGMRCTITLAGQTAFSGLVHTRQVFYDANKHYIEIQGASPVLELAYAHVIHKTMEFNNKTMQQIIDELVQPFGITFTVEGGSLPTDKIPRYSVAPGTTVTDAVERLIRNSGGANLTSNLSGNLVAAVGPVGGGDTVREGDNMLEGREIIFNPAIYGGTHTLSQKPPNDQEWGPAAAQIKAESNISSTAGQKTQQVIISEIPGFTKELMTNRGDMDRKFQNEDQVTIYATVYGWLSPSGVLWDRNEIVKVVSPMLIMDGSEKLKVRNVTFTQDNNSGTRTTLMLCNDEAWAPIPQTGGAP